MEERFSRGARMLLETRTSMKLSQVQLAKRAGITQAQYQRLEHGDRSIARCSARIVLSLCKVMEIDPYTFIFDERAGASKRTMNTP